MGGSGTSYLPSYPQPGDKNLGTALGKLKPASKPSFGLLLFEAAQGEPVRLVYPFQCSALSI